MSLLNTHELASAWQQARRIPQRCTVKESNMYMRREYIDVAEERISQTCSRTAAMQNLPDFIDLWGTWHPYFPSSKIGGLEPSVS